ncbi:MULTISPECIES: SdiA-regulated domain-containing protein [Pseudomonas]|uniref:SdiA-regulated domain-containing protein n=1 Tax=Pseudomonas nitroreducens TaxID=46680 RepID=UPI001E4913CE|nr:MULTISPECIES: SdiA-regulated domain-containing protein [Pseudomonas]MCE4069054.1 SdiA-regulated domain-containing protein [Pseudomonas nitritireducens]MCE4078243.1 SdiA-regulated domain-containing protein [Pseudomonas nitroreducens]
MRRLLKPRRLFLLLALFALALLLALGQSFRVYERAWFKFNEWRHAALWQDKSIWLPDYRVVLEAQPIEGLEENVSALTYDPDRQTLFTVTNKQNELVELSLEGKVLRKIELHGFGDTEAIEYISRNVYVITDETHQRLIRVELGDDTRELRIEDAQQLALALGRGGNSGFEGLAYDSVGKRLFVAKERKPVHIYEVRGFPYEQSEQPIAVHVVEDLQHNRNLFVRDLSSLQYDERSGHLLALSDESRLVLELSADGEPISSLSLLRGMSGLRRSVPQAEGIAMDDQGTLYLVSEPNLFYVFKKREAH